MSESAPNFRNKKRRRVVFASVSLLAVLLASWPVLAFIEQVREAVDRAH